MQMTSVLVGHRPGALTLGSPQQWPLSLGLLLLPRKLRKESRHYPQSQTPAGGSHAERVRLALKQQPA